ncbi:MAG: sulfur carrier protein ThiS [Synergistaceae bacterium]|jgi:sulfur carrier protein|nr:sulfur carrier protein ThiS [Synergistaceae bacterium]
MIMVNGDEFEWREGLTVQDILDEKKYTFRLISVWINGEVVKKRGDYASTPVPDGGEVEILHMMSGG